ncbi:tyrosine-protein phosphatase (plasmid) [Streptomyces viridifaciens]|nr:tyrosine-protein phosphatase [Streptomyces viridifaciens]
MNDSHRMCNFRDVGPLTRADGSTLPAGWLFRSDAPSADSTSDLEHLRTFGITTIVDLRSDGEDPVRPVGIASSYAYVQAGIDPVDWADEALGHDDMATFLSERYLAIADRCLLDDSPMGRALTVLIAPPDEPRIVWCAGGKDRTGIVMAIALRLLKVTDDAIQADYACSSAAAAELRRRARTASPSVALSGPTSASGAAGSAVERRAALRQSVAAFPGGVGRFSNPAPPQAVTRFLHGLCERYGTVERYAELTGVDLRTVHATNQILSSRPVRPPLTPTAWNPDLQKELGE